MNNSKKWIIHWENFAQNSYTYGTTLKFFENKEVYYKNILVNTGIVINEWFSKTNYQMNRIIPNLPLLSENKKYKIKIDADETPSNTLYIRINFYDIYNNLTNYTIIREKKGYFIYPKDSYKYTVQIFSAGLKELHFRNFKITEIKEEYAEEKIENFDKSYPYINVIFKHPNFNNQADIDFEIKAKIKNIYVYQNIHFDDKYYLDEKKEHYLRELINIYPNYKFNFIGYTDITNQAALYFANKFSKVSYISDDFHTELKNKNIKKYQTSQLENKNLHLLKNILQYDYKLINLIKELEK